MAVTIRPESPGKALFLTAETRTRQMPRRRRRAQPAPRKGSRPRRCWLARARQPCRVLSALHRAPFLSSQPQPRVGFGSASTVLVVHVDLRARRPCQGPRGSSHPSPLARPPVPFSWQNHVCVARGTSAADARGSSVTCCSLSAPCCAQCPGPPRGSRMLSPFSGAGSPVSHLYCVVQSSTRARWTGHRARGHRGPRGPRCVRRGRARRPPFRPGLATGRFVPRANGPRNQICR
mmetsp:Transcript_5358/g.15319  ORF Transcript_5358/g.15319 Transcript_5358/m.15319 type:complete len:234 (-) Transcript_5358:292-993(-)